MVRRAGLVGFAALSADTLTQTGQNPDGPAVPKRRSFAKMGYTCRSVPWDTRALDIGQAEIKVGFGVAVPSGLPEPLRALTGI